MISGKINQVRLQEKESEMNIVQQLQSYRPRCVISRGSDEKSWVHPNRVLHSKSSVTNINNKKKIELK